MKICSACRAEYQENQHHVCQGTHNATAVGVMPQAPNQTVRPAAPPAQPSSTQPQPQSQPSSQPPVQPQPGSGGTASWLSDPRASQVNFFGPEEPRSTNSSPVPVPQKAKVSGIFSPSSKARSSPPQSKPILPETAWTPAADSLLNGPEPWRPVVVAADQAPANQAPANQAPANQSPANQAPANQAPANQSPANQSPANQAPANQAPANQSPANQAPANQSPANQAPANQAPANQPGSNEPTVANPQAPYVTSSDYADTDDSQPLPEVFEETIDMRFHMDTRKDPLIGKVISDRYKIISVVGSGGMGVVYQAEHRNLDRPVAIKMLHPHLVAEPGAIQRFRTEAQAVSKVEHPHSVLIYDFGVTDVGQPYIVMDFIEGTSLGKVLKQSGTLGINRAAEIFNQVIEALSCAHEAGVIHRDLKPENIMLSHRGASQDFVSVVDFGISTVVTSGQSDERFEGQKSRDTIGSPPYMSPEQCSDGAKIDQRSDVYSLAVVVFETLSGRYPYNARTQSQFVDAHLNGQPIGLKSVSDALSACDALTDVLNRALEKRPEKRQQSIAEFGAELNEAIKKDSIRLNYLKNRKNLMSQSGSMAPLHLQTPPSELPVLSGDTPHIPVEAALTQENAFRNTVYANCPHCNEPVQKEVAFCLGCGRSLANPHELSKLRAASGVFVLPKQTDSESGTVPVFSQKVRAVSRAQSMRRTNIILLAISAVLLMLIVFWISGGAGIVSRTLNPPPKAADDPNPAVNDGNSTAP